ncbi:hypothetical protein FRC11_007115 [Ceratobasidium sp. 423]|nr:hypothetical protein FRC11_007115 [Ceratobasidium sp. 423]
MSSIPEYGVYRIKLFSSDGKKTTKLVQPLANSPETSLVVDDTTPAPASNPGWDQWTVRPISSTEGVIYTFEIRGTDGRYLSCGDDDLKLEPSSNTTWNVELVTVDEKTEPELRISTDDKWGEFINVNNEGQPKFESLGELKPRGEPRYSGWKFELVALDERVWPATMAQPGKSFQQKFFGLTLEEASREKYDIIIVGSGIGGGILANDFYDTNFKLGRNAKRILLLERGDLVFHSHCLNTARPAGLMNDRGQQNDTFFNQFKEEFKFATPLSDKQWSGGPMYNLGGRSAAWGLFSPRVHDTVLQEHFDSDVAEALKNEFYDKAERLMLISLPTTRRSHQHIMDRLTSKCQEVEPSTAPWHWGRIASEFKDDQNFDFAEGAYSTIDKIIEIAMSRPEVRAEGVKNAIPIQHKYFRTVLNAEVRSLVFDSGELGSVVTGVNVRKPSKGPNDTLKIELRDQGKVILCAGSVDSPAILLRSPLAGIDDKLREPDVNGLHLTDHTVVYYQCSFRYDDTAKRSEDGAMKLQTYAKLDGSMTLVNMSVDASSFLPRGKAPDPNLPKFIIVFMHQQKLVEENTIKLNDPDQAPEITMVTNPRLNEEPMKKFTLAAMKALAGSAGLEFVGFEGLNAGSKVDTEKEREFLGKIGLGYLPLGGVAHELGTLPMKVEIKDETTGAKTLKQGYCLDENLAVRPEICKGVYVCDLSVLPHSPEANPTLTLAALAIRLSRHLHPRLNVTGKLDKDTVYVVNHSGAKVKVFLSKHQSGKRPEAAEREILLEPGQWYTWTRQAGVPQALLVYQLDRSKGPKSVFLEKAIILEAHPGKVTTILSS